MSKKKHSYISFDGKEELNPMNSVSNLSDIMLILAVGIMLALVMHWNVPIVSSPGAVETEETNAVEFSADDLESIVELPENMQKTGEVYYDPESGSYYIINDVEP